MDDIYKNIEEYNPNNKRKILIVFDDMIADMLSNKKRNPEVTELFVRVENYTFLLFLLHNLIFFVSKNIRLNSTDYFIMKIPNKRELQRTVPNNLSNMTLKTL